MNLDKANHSVSQLDRIERRVDGIAHGNQFFREELAAIKAMLSQMMANTATPLAGKRATNEVIHTAEEERIADAPATVALPLPRHGGDATCTGHTATNAKAAPEASSLATFAKAAGGLNHKPLGAPSLGKSSTTAVASRASIRGDVAALHDAASKGDLITIRALVDEKRCVRASDRAAPSTAPTTPSAARAFAPTALYVAAANGHADVVRYFVKEKGVDVESLNDAANFPRNGGQTKPPLSCRRVATPPLVLHTALHAACEKGHLAVVRTLVEELGADPNGQVCERGVHLCNSCACSLACDASEASTSSLPPPPQRDEGVSPSSSFSACVLRVPPSPLYLAAKNDHVDIVRYLVKEKGVSLETRNGTICSVAGAQHGSAVCASCGCGRNNILVNFSSSSSAERIPHTSVDGGDNNKDSNPTTATAAITLSLLPIVPNPALHGRTALHVACYYGCLQTIKCIVGELMMPIAAAGMAAPALRPHGAVGTSAGGHVTTTTTTENDTIANCGNEEREEESNASRERARFEALLNAVDTSPDAFTPLRLGLEEGYLDDVGCEFLRQRGAV